MKGRIYDLSVLFDDDGKIYAIHGYGEVHCTQLKPDMSGPMEETDRIISPEGSSVGEGHHMYKINGMYYLISTDYKPNGRTLCSRSKSIWGPYETCVITADEPFGRKGEEVAFDEGVDASVGAAEHKEDVVGVGRVDEGIDDGRVQAHALAVVATAVEVGCRDVGTVGMPGGLRQKKHRGDQRSEHDVRIISYSPVRGPPLLL